MSLNGIGFVFSVQTNGILRILSRAISTCTYTLTDAKWRSLRDWQGGERERASVDQLEAYKFINNIIVNIYSNAAVRDNRRQLALLGKRFVQFAHAIEIII